MPLILQSYWEEEAVGKRINTPPLPARSAKIIDLPLSVHHGGGGIILKLTSVWTVLSSNHKYPMGFSNFEILYLDPSVLRDIHGLDIVLK